MYPTEQLFCVDIFVLDSFPWQKKPPVKKAIPSLPDIRDRIVKLKSNKSRLELRKIQIAARALGAESKIKSNEADIMKLSSLEESMMETAKTAS